MVHKKETKLEENNLSCGEKFKYIFVPLLFLYLYICSAILRLLVLTVSISYCNLHYEVLELLHYIIEKSCWNLPYKM